MFDIICSIDKRVVHIEGISIFQVGLRYEVLLFYMQCPIRVNKNVIYFNLDWVVVYDPGRQEPLFCNKTRKAEDSSGISYITHMRFY